MIRLRGEHGPERGSRTRKETPDNGPYENDLAPVQVWTYGLTHLRVSGRSNGDAAQAVACDAAMAPFVTGEVNPAALEDLVRLCVELDRLRHHPRTGDGTGQDGTGSDGNEGSSQDAPAPDTARAWEAIERAVIGKTIEFLLHYIDACDLRLHPRTSSRPMSVALEGQTRAILPDRRNPIPDQGQHSVSALAPSNA